jgi:hypothetical protein
MIAEQKRKRHEWVMKNRAERRRHLEEIRGRIEAIEQEVMSGAELGKLV